jgi:catechol 2,3-dioxygenase-like lactoylglutathione lyase family enzyme
MPPSFEQTITFLHTADLDTTAEFYEQLLGLELVRDQGVCRIYRTSGDGFIGFCQHLESAAPQGVILTLVCEDVDGNYEILRKKGVQFSKAPAYNSKFGIYHCFFTDPNGYLLEIQRFDEPLQ